jgi:hypothetical protein
MHFIFRSDTLGVSGCVSIVCSRCLWLLHVHVVYLWFKQYIEDACKNKEHQLPNNMYYVTQAWKYNNILEI